VRFGNGHRLFAHLRNSPEASLFLFPFSPLSAQKLQVVFPRRSSCLSVPVHPLHGKLGLLLPVSHRIKMVDHTSPSVVFYKRVASLSGSFLAVFQCDSGQLPVLACRLAETLRLSSGRLLAMMSAWLIYCLLYTSVLRAPPNPVPALTSVPRLSWCCCDASRSSVSAFLMANLFATFSSRSRATSGGPLIFASNCPTSGSRREALALSVECKGRTVADVFALEIGGSFLLLVPDPAFNRILVVGNPPGQCVFSRRDQDADCIFFFLLYLCPFQCRQIVENSPPCPFPPFFFLAMCSMWPTFFSPPLPETWRRPLSTMSAGSVFAARTTRPTRSSGS